MPIDMQSLARAGAQSRIAELIAEVTEIRSAFPDIEGQAPRRRERERPRGANPDGNGGRHRRKPMTPAQKRPVGQRMKAYWAAPRSDSGNAAEASDQAQVVAPTKRVMSPEAREKIAAAQRKRWRKLKRAGKKR
jgi:hypothetical protein